MRLIKALNLLDRDAMPELCDAQSSPTQVELHPINLELDTDANVSYLQQQQCP